MHGGSAVVHCICNFHKHFHIDRGREACKKWGEGGGAEVCPDHIIMHRRIRVIDARCSTVLTDGDSAICDKQHVRLSVYNIQHLFMFNSKQGLNSI